MGWRSKAEKAKKGHRSSLKDWSCDELYKTFPMYRDSVLAQANFGYNEYIPDPKQTQKRSYHYYIGESRDRSNDNIDGIEREPIPARIDARHTPPSEFHSNFEAKLVPTVITNIPQGFDIPLPPPLTQSSSSSSSRKTNSSIENGITKNEKGMDVTINAWKGLSNWDLESLSSHDTLRERLFKCGEDDDGKSIKLKLKHFIRYLEKNNDDSPLYVFDSSFEDDRHAKRILDDYRVPSYFNEDLFHLVGESRRPPYRWFLIGPERSGTCIHIDPLATSAWNTLIIGKKRWVLFPPHLSKSVVKGYKQTRKGEDDEAIHYFTTILPRIKKAAKNNPDDEKYKNFECYEFTQYENETVYIPNGWWHAVLNLTDTVGVTQNFCSQRNFDQVWLKTRTGRKKMAYKWLKKLEESYPHLAARAVQLNKEDKFVMKYDPKEVEKQEKKERKEKEKKKSNKESSSSSSHGPSTKNSDKSFSRDAKRSRVDRIVSPDFAYAN